MMGRCRFALIGPLAEMAWEEVSATHHGDLPNIPGLKTGPRLPVDPILCRKGTPSPTL